MSHAPILKHNKNDISLEEEEKILNELKQEIEHHDIFSFKLGNKSLNAIISNTKPFDKKFFHYQRYNFKLQDLNPDICTFYDIALQNKKDNNININNDFKDENLIDEDGKRRKIHDILSDNNLQISEVLENIMEDVNIFDKIYQEEQDKIQNEEIKIEVEENTSKNELKYMLLQQLKENEKIKEDKPKTSEENKQNRIYPIEMVNKIEKDYNNILVEKIKNETKNTDLYPLDTYKKNNDLKIQLISENEKDLQFQSLKEVMLIKEKTNTVEEKDLFCTFIVDKPNQEPGSIEPIFMYVGTNMGKIVKILLNNKKNQNNIREIFDSKENGINCIDIFENSMVTGHQNGTILFWEDNKIFDKTKNSYQSQKNIEIISLKFIKIFPKKKYEIIYSDKIGKVYFLKRIKGILKDTETKELLINDKIPIYKISFISPQNDLKKTKKKLMLFALTSAKGVTIIKIRPKIENKEEKESQNQQNLYSTKVIGFPSENNDYGIFDSSFGFGFPPMQDKSPKNNIRGSISDSIVIGKDELENLLFAISFGEIINLYDTKISRSNKIYINPIGHFINDKPIINISFLTNSYIAIITYDFFLKIINTFDFDRNIYTKKHEPTKNSLLTYEPIELKKLIMMRQTNIFKYSEIDKKFNNYYIYLNTIATLNKSIIILGRQNLYQYTLLQWEPIIQSLDKDKEYEKMLWLSMVVFNSNKNLLTIQSKNKNQDFLKNNKEQICSAIISKFLVQVVMVEIEKNNNFYPIRMLIEFCIGAEFYDCLYEAILPLSQKGYDGYLYQNLTKYILNDDCKEIDFKPIFLFNYMKYYVEMREKIILSEALFHINIFSLLEQNIILSALEEYKLINPAIYTQIKNMKKGEIDYFKPIKYLYDFFHKDLYKEKENKLFETESDKVVKEDYNKLMIQNEMNYYNEDVSTYFEYLGHKILWYCNKCLSGEEFHTNIKISRNHFEKVSKKIIVFLTIEEIMKEFLEFDSYSYFQVINRFFIEDKLFNLIHRDVEGNQNLFKDIDNFIDLYLGKKKIPSHVLSEKYFFYEIQEKAESFKNIYIKFDYYKMIALICKKNKKFHLDKASIKNAIKFFINYFCELKKSNFVDKYNCHKKPDNLYEYERQKDEIESDILTMINSFEFHNELIRDDIDEILNLNNIYLFTKTRIYLYEASNRFEESFELHKKELEDENSTIPRNERIKLFFEWINNILSYTLYGYDNKKEEQGIYHQKFKDFLLSNFNYLSSVSLSELSNLVDTWFKGQEEKIITKLNDSKSLSLQFKYINYYLANHEYDPEQSEENNTYYKLLLIKINLLIKANNKEQVLNVLHHNNFLCKISLLNDLLNKEVYDSCIFIYHILGKLDEGIELAKREIKKTLDEIMEEITSKKYNSTNIDNKLNKFKKYVDLGLGICQKSEIMRKREIDLVDDYWLLLINVIYTFQIKFKPEFNKNKNNYKTVDYIKINNFLNETFESAIAKMTDCISLPLILDVMGEKCGEAGFTKFKQLNFMMFSNFRLSENIFNLMKSLIESGINIEVDNYLYERNKGHFAIIRECGICKEFLGKGNMDKIKYFNCNHVYHNLCFLKEGGGNECLICKKDDCIINKNENNYFGVIDKIKYNQNLEKMKKKEIELTFNILKGFLKN